MNDANVMQTMRMVLQRLPTLAVSMDSGDQDPVLTVRGFPRPTTEGRGQWRLWVEALELLAITWRVDRHAWLQLVTEKGGKPIAGYMTKDGKLPANWIHLPVTDHPELIHVFLDAVFTPVQDHEYSNEFRVARASLLAQRRPETMEPIPVGIVLEDERNNQRGFITRWYETVRDLPLRCSLTGVGFLGELDRQKIHGLRLQVDSGLAIGRANLRLLRGSDVVTRHELNQLISDLQGESGATWLDFTSMNYRRDAMEFFFSKLLADGAGRLRAGNSGVRSLVLMNTYQHGTPAPVTRATLLWLLYGLFSQDAHHSISHLFLSIRHNPRLPNDIGWLAHLLRTEGAPRLELLFPEVYDKGAARFQAPAHDQRMVPFQSPAQDQWLVLPTGYPIHVELGGDSPDHTLTFEDRVTRFRVVRDDPSVQCIDILVPGYGLCYVRRSETLMIQTTSRTRWTFDEHSIRSMEIEVGAHDMDTIFGLLSLVGRPVQSLCITYQGGGNHSYRYLGVEQLIYLLRCCPRLETVRLVSVEVLELTWQQLYELPEWNIKKVELSGLSAKRRGSTRALILALANPSLRISRTLRELWLDMSHADLADRDGEESLMTCMLEMLTVNQVLTTVSLHISPSHWTVYGSQLRAIRETILPVRKAPLSFRAKCALLSVVEYTRLPLAQDAIANVFEFAAERETRVVIVTTSSSDLQ